MWTGNTLTGQQVIYDNFAMPRRTAIPNAQKDDGDWGFSVTGPGWTTVAGSGYQGDYRLHTAGVGESATNVARWTITQPLGAGIYELFATYVARPTNSTAAVYRIYDGATFRGAIVVNQRNEPTGIKIGTTNAVSLGTYQTTTSTFRIELSSLGGGGDVVADGVFDPPVEGVLSPTTGNRGVFGVVSLAGSALMPGPARLGKSLREISLDQKACALHSAALDTVFGGLGRKSIASSPSPARRRMPVDLDLLSDLSAGTSAKSESSLSELSGFECADLELLQLHVRTT